MFIKSAALATILLTASQVDAFGAPMKARTGPFGTIMLPHRSATASSAAPAFHQLSSTTTTSSTQLFATGDVDTDSEVDRLRSMAAKLRAEAATMEADKKQEQADATARAFSKFDTNDDGQVTLEELKAGLEKALKTELKEERVKQLMEEFDASGDGALQVDEFVSVDQFRNRLESMVRDEQSAAKESQRQAKLESEASQLAEAKMNLLNDGAPSNSDKILSVIPYLLPLLDGLAFGRFLLEGQDNPAVALLALLFTLYRSIPFSGFISFLALSVLSGNFNINKLVRFNMQQAIYLDIALFVPGLIASLYTIVGGGLGISVPENIPQLGNDAVFVVLLATIGYSVVSSLLGVAPDKIPGISGAVAKRMPSIDMFDAEGRFIAPTPEEDTTNDNDKK
jgi:hypothetical protein